LNNYVLPVITAILLLGLFYVYRKFGHPIVSFFTFAIWVLGIVVSIASYGSVGEFWDDLRPELIGLTFDIGLLYILLEFFRRRDEQRKEKETLNEYLAYQLNNFLDFASARYNYVLTDEQISYLSPEDLEELVGEVKTHFNREKFKDLGTLASVDDLHLYESYNTSSDRIDPDMYVVLVSEYDIHFRIPVQKQIEKIIYLYQRIMPNGLYEDLLRLNHKLARSAYLTLISVTNTNDQTIIKELQKIGNELVKLRKKYMFH
jgi:hypothetical protein